MKMRKLICVTLALLTAAALGACAAPKPRRYWVRPAESAPSQTTGRLLTYQVERVDQGVKETVRLPITSVPDAIIVDGQTAGGSAAGSTQAADHAPATLADEALLGKKEQKPGLSYLRSLEKIENLYAQGKYAEALVHLTPLLKHYPRKARLYAMQGTLLKELHENELADEAYRKAASLDPDNAAYERMTR
jgi:tetratricopeptide (TPR) repeat protein